MTTETINPNHESLEKVIFSYSCSDKRKILAGSYIAGVIAGGTGRLIGGDSQYAIPAVLPAMSALNGKFNKHQILPTIAYGLGVATTQVDNIVKLVGNYIS